MYELKVKAKSLAAESKIIRIEELKLKRTPVRYKDKKVVDNIVSLAEHRRWNVRNEARATHLARAFLAGKTYVSVESNCKDRHFLFQWILPRVISMVKKYGGFDHRLVSHRIVGDWADK